MAYRENRKRQEDFQTFLRRTTIERKFAFTSLTDPNKTFTSKAIHPQDQSPLFGVLPFEIRNLIFTFVLTDYERYILSNDGKERKLYFLPRIHGNTRRTDTELLRTCKRVFQETWFMSFALAKHGIHLYYKKTDPPHAFSVECIEAYLRRAGCFFQAQPETPKPRIDAIQLFLGGQDFQQKVPGRLSRYPPSIEALIRLRECRPRIVTFTIDYARDHPKFMRAGWVNDVRFPQSVRFIEMEFRADRMGKYVLALMGNFVAKNWFFRREDGVVFKPATLERLLRYISDDPNNEGSAAEYDGKRSGKYYTMLINTVTLEGCPRV